MRPPCPTGPAGAAQTMHRMKVLLWIVAIIFLIGLLVVFGLGSVVF